MTEKIQPIPHRLKNMAVGGHVAGAEDIFDDRLGINQERVNEVLQNGINALDSQNYYYAEATDQTSSVTDVLPASGAADTLYRVAFWDGEQYDATVYSEYTWDGEGYQLLDVKEPGIDDEPTPGSTNLVKSGSVYREEELIRNSMESLTPLTPFEDVDGKVIRSSGEEASNPAFGYMKYVADPNTVYYISTKIQGSQIILWVVNYFDSEGEFIDHEVYLTIGGTESVQNVKVKTPSNAAFIYVNYQKSLKQATILSEVDATNQEAAVELSQRAYGLDNVIVYRDKYYSRTQGVVGSKSECLVSYSVKPNTKYTFTMSTPANTRLDVYIIACLDSNLSLLASPAIKFDPTEAVDYDVTIVTPSSCAYVYINCPYVSLDSLNLLYKDIDDIDMGGEIKEDYVFEEPSEVLENISISVPAEGETEPTFNEVTGRRTTQYVLDPTKKYLIDYSIDRLLNAYLVYYVDENGDYISREFKNDTGKRFSGSTVLNPPAGTYYVYIKDNMSGSSLVSLKSVSTTDRTSEILAELTNKKICRLGAGTYYINALRMPDGTTLQGDGKLTRLVLGGTSDGYAVRLGARCTIKDLSIDGADLLQYKGEDNISIDSILMDGNRHGILLLGTGDNKNYAGSVIENVEITNFTGGGITCENTGGSPYSSLTVSDCWIRNCCVGINITRFSEFNKFVNVGCFECRYGVINNGGNNTFTSCTFSSNTIGVYMNGGTGKCVKYDGTTATATNEGHGVIDSCKIAHNGKDNDHVGYGIVVIAQSSGMILSSLSMGFNNFHFESSSRVVLSNVRIGTYTGFEIVNMTAPMVISNVLGSSAAFSPFTVSPASSFDTDGNVPGQVYMYGCFKVASKATPQSLMGL